MGNLATGTFKTIKFFFDNPIGALILIAGVLLMPLDVLDFLLSFLVNIFVILFNVIAYLLIIIGNGIISLINWALDALVSAIGFGLSSPPDLALLEFKAQEYVTIDIFDSGVNLLSMLLDIFM